MVPAGATQTPRFAGHETFPLRYGWLKKAVDGIEKDPDVFTRADALVTLGVGKNMVRSIRHWALATAVVEVDAAVPKCRRLRLARLGKVLFGERGIDPFLEEPGSLWLLHWQLCSSPYGPTTWFWVFNHVADLEFTKERLLSMLQSLVETNGWSRVAPSTLRRDVDCFLRTYTAARASRVLVLEDTLDCPLVELGLLHELEEGQMYGFVRDDHPSLPTWVVAFATLKFWEASAPNRHTLTFDEIAYRPGSPGQVFKLSEDGLARHLESLETSTKRGVGYGVTGGLRQVYRRKEVTAETILDAKLAERTRRKQG